MSSSENGESLRQVAQLRTHIAWLGESGKMGWWETDALDADAGGAMLRGILPKTSAWAALQVAWASAAVVEGRLVTLASAITLFRMTPAVDARVLAWLRGQKHSGESAEGLVPTTGGDHPTAADAFTAWSLVPPQVAKAARSVVVPPGAQTIPLGHVARDSLSTPTGLVAAAQRLAAGYVHGSRGHVVAPFLEIT
jgi:hypothetical protein